MDAKQAREYGTTTGRKRRMGWFDAPLVRYAVGLSGVDSIALTKLDVLDGLQEIKICVGYRIRGVETEFPPPLAEELKQIEPIYETLKGWQTSTKGCAKLEDLPKEARGYLHRIEALCGVPISFVSIGPGREETIYVRDIYATTSS